MGLLERLESIKKEKQAGGGGKPGGGGFGGKGGPTSAPKTPAEELKSRIQDYLIRDADPNILQQPDPEIKRTLLRAKIEEQIAVQAGEIGASLTKKEHEVLIGELIDDILGLGPIQVLIESDDISEIMVNGPNQTYMEKKGKIVLADVKFKDDEHVKLIIQKIISPLGRRCDESMPYVDARLKDGSRVNAVIPPLALNGPTITIRKFKKDPLKVADLIKFGSMTEDQAQFLKACVEIHRNCVVSGGTGSGKTTLLNVLSSFISESDRIITVEDAAEIQLQQPHWVRLETKSANVEGKGAVTMRDLIKNTLRMRPDRVIVGECRGGETLDMLQAMNTGHDGSLTTLHANTPIDAIRRIETMVLMAGVDLPSRAIREQIAGAVHMIVQQSRLGDGSRRVMFISETVGFDGQEVQIKDIFKWIQTGVNAETGKFVGHVQPMKHVPTFYHKFAANGIDLPLTFFGLTEEEGKKWLEENPKGGKVAH